VLIIQGGVAEYVLWSDSLRFYCAEYIRWSCRACSLVRQLEVFFVLLLQGGVAERALPLVRQVFAACVAVF